MDDKQSRVSTYLNRCVYKQNRRSTWHRHVQLIGGNAAGAAVYPPKLVEAVLFGLRRQMETSGNLSSLQAFSSGPVAEVQDIPEGERSHFLDHVNGGYLNTEMVKKAREEELSWVRQAELYDVVPRQQCLEATGKPPVTLRWVDLRIPRLLNTKL